MADISPFRTTSIVRNLLLNLPESVLPLQYSPVVMDIEGINIRDVEEINYDLVEKIGNLRHPMISVVIETVSDLNNMLKESQNTALFKKYVLLGHLQFPCDYVAMN